jgi:predicted O-methyltransferase YrrM
MNKVHMILQYLKYRLHAKTRHGIHSPFVYSFIEEVIYDGKTYPEYAIIENEISKLKQNRNVLEIVDFGASGNKQGYKTRFRRISTIAALSGISKRHGRLLYRIVKHFKPATMLELGTSLGISTMYQAKGKPDAQFTGIEGCATVASITRSSLDAVGCTNVNLLMAQFKTALPDYLSGLATNLDYAFIDGDHTYEGTMSYFNQLKNHVSSNSILIFHDIYWSEGMKRAWEEIKQDTEVKVTVDLFYMGIVFFRSELSKQDFVVRF